MNDLSEFKFNDIYELAYLVDVSVKGGFGFCNYDNAFFIQAG